jgi:hypothetical protein
MQQLGELTFHLQPDSSLPIWHWNHPSTSCPANERARFHTNRSHRVRAKPYFVSGRLLVVKGASRAPTTGAERKGGAFMIAVPATDDEVPLTVLGPSSRIRPFVFVCRHPSFSKLAFGER